MSQVFITNPESSVFPENNNPPKVETSKLISLFEKNNRCDRFLIMNKCLIVPRFINNDYLAFLLITLKVQDNITFFQNVFLSHFLEYTF